MLYVIVIQHEIVIHCFPFMRVHADTAERKFVEMMKEYIWNFGDYSYDEVQACLEDGYEGFGQGNSIQLFWDEDDV